jgi:tRNA-modifying protein YgfZ
MTSHPLDSMLTTPPAHGATRLDDWGLIVARGADAASFLHGQLTQSVTDMDVGQVRLAGFCSAKGRLMASFVIWRTGAQEFHLACSADLLAPTLKRLRMFVLRAKCELLDANDTLALWGALGQPTMVDWPTAPAVGRASAAGDKQMVHLSAGRFLLVQAKDAAAPPLPVLAPEAWAWQEVLSGVARIVAATSEHFVPQMVNFELVGGVNFQKGCYPGQEVVARSQYRGTIKRRAQVFTTQHAMQPGQEVFSSESSEQPAGEVVLAASQGANHHAALVEIKLEALRSGSLHLGAATGPTLVLGALPYALPNDAA